MLISMLLLWLAAVDVGDILKRPFEQWTLDESIELLNDSPWAKQATFTQVIGGVGSGVRGEKEILSTFYVRILSARPIREALARVHQINHRFDEMEAGEQRRLRELLEPGIRTPMRRWIVVAVSFRSNDPERENAISRFLETQTAETLRNQAFLSTDRVARVALRAYFPPRGDGIGARFVFPRFLGGEEVFRNREERLLFQLEMPELETPLTVGFSLNEMSIDGELIL